jgi:hypothetical protein
MGEDFLQMPRYVLAAMTSLSWETREKHTGLIF